MTKKCANILVYFGKFNSYFPLFLKSCEKNEEYDWFIFTDNQDIYEYPKNVKVVPFTLSAVKTLAEKKFGFEVALKTPYKLCDYKPAYGFLFEEYIQDYEYWGHCDCDLIFGNLSQMLTPILDEGYDKVFAAGHYTLYKNNPKNNRRFMNLHNGVAIYKEAFATDEIYVFDEDYQDKRHTDNNVHSIFLEDGAKVFAQDLSMNVKTNSAKFIRAKYDETCRCFILEPYVLQRYYWDNGSVYSLCADEEKDELRRMDFIYIHLQGRKMRNRIKDSMSQSYEILSDRFIEGKIPNSKMELKVNEIGKAYLYWWDVFFAKISRKVKRIFQVKN